MTSTETIKRVPWTLALDEYGSWRVGEGDYSPATWAGERSGLNHFGLFMMTRGIYTPAEVTREDVTAWYTALQVGPSTKPTRVSQLRTFLKFCREEGLMDSDPTVRLRAKKSRSSGATKDRLDAAELLALLDLCRLPHERIMLALCINLGLRASELTRLRVGDVDLERHEIRVRIEKTDEDDLMPISEDLADELSRWLDHYEDHAQVLHQSYLVPSHYWDNHNGRSIYRHLQPTTHPERVIKRALKGAGWSEIKGEGVHTVRRSLATVYFDMVEAEESFDSALLATMTLLHHSRPQTTLDYIGRNRAVLARDRAIKGKRFLSKLAGVEDCKVLRVVR